MTSEGDRILIDGTEYEMTDMPQGRVIHIIPKKKEPRATGMLICNDCVTGPCIWSAKSCGPPPKCHLGGKWRPFRGEIIEESETEQWRCRWRHKI